MRVVEFWKSHPRAEAAGVSLLGSNGDTVVVERLDERTGRYSPCGSCLAGVLWPL